MYKEPKWVKSIPKGSHGSGDLQKRLWKLVSDYTRIRDWHQYGGRCVATGEYIQEWKLGQGGHYIHYTKCNGIFKFDIWNVHMQSAISNKLSSQVDGHAFGEELKKRYGEGFLDELKLENRSHINEKVENSLVVNEILDILELMKSLPEQPEYFSKVMNKINEERN